MSIPTPFDPLGTLGALVEFKQTFMTDGHPRTDTWEEEPSVRWSTAHMVSIGEFYGWKAFDEDKMGYYQWLWDTLYEDKLPYELGYVEFAKPLYMQEIEVANYSGTVFTRQYGEIEFYNFETGDVYGRIMFPTQKLYETRSLKNINKWVKKLGMRITDTKDYGFGISFIKFTAKHEA